MSEYREQYLIAKDNDIEPPPIPDYAGECFLKIAEKLSHRPNFINYAFREEMVSDGIENCVMYANNFNPEKSQNPFAYFTQITYYAFLRRIAKEKKHQDIKELYMEHAGASGFMEVGDHPDATGIVERVRFKSQMIRDRDSAIKKFGKELKKKDKTKKRIGILDEFV